jgi:Zn-dependent protease
VLLPVAAALLWTWTPALGRRYLLLLGVLAVHEFGHALASLVLGGRRARISLSPAFGWADVEAFADRREGWVALAGPVANLALAGGLALWGAGLDWGLRRATLPDFLFTVTLLMGLGNLIPLRPADGGRAVAAFWRAR